MSQYTKKGSLSEVDYIKRLCTWADEFFKYVEAQSGFRANVGTHDIIFVLHSRITHIINLNKQLLYEFMEFPKASEYVVRENMSYKPFHLRI